MSVTVHVGDCHDVLQTIDPESIHLTVTSPPYDQIRDYHGKPTFDAKKLAEQLFRVTVDGGMCCVVIQDQTKNFRKSLTSFRLACSFVDAGWGLFETCIYHRDGVPGEFPLLRIDHEYIFMFVRGTGRPRAFNGDQIMVPAKHPGIVYDETVKKRVRDADGGFSYRGSTRTQGAFKRRGTVWHYNPSAREANRTKLKHPATFPDKLAADLIAAFSHPGDTILDPFSGSGTTLVMANQLARNAIGIEISPQYAEIIHQRLGLFAA